MGIAYHGIVKRQAKERSQVVAGHMNIVIPQWQGGGQDMCTYYAAFALRDNYLGDAQTVTAEVSTDLISPTEHDMQGYRDIVTQIAQVNELLAQHAPERIFTVGGGCDADIPCAAYLNEQADGKLAMVYLDAHGDLNLPQTSESKLFYGMSLRALMGEGDQAVVESLARTMGPDQLFMGANRALDPEEVRYQRENGVVSLSVEQLEERPQALAEAIAAKGFDAAYIHIDLDCLDPREFSLMPVPEPDGLKCDTLLAIVRAIQDVCSLKGFSIMEYCGTKDDRGNELLQQLVNIGLGI